VTTVLRGSARPPSRRRQNATRPSISVTTGQSALFVSQSSGLAQRISGSASTWATLLGTTSPTISITGARVTVLMSSTTSSRCRAK